MTVADELFRIADRMEAQSKSLQGEKLSKPLKVLNDAAEEVGKAWSGSWLGYHSRVYYADFSEPPPGARFSQEWGMMETFAMRYTVGDWKEYRFDDVVSVIQKNAGNPVMNEQKERSSSAGEEFEEAQSQVLSLLSGILDMRKDDKFLRDIAEKVKGMKIFSANDLIKAMSPSGEMMSRDMTAIQAGMRTPPHISVLAQVYEIQYPFTACEELSKLSRRAASHIQNVEKHKKQSDLF
jgi:hypothetical protein